MSILYLIPTVIAEESLLYLPKTAIEITHSLKHFIVERTRTARRFIKATNPPYEINEVQFIEIDKRSASHIEEIKQWFNAGHNIGLMSEAGIPAIADPGSEVVQLAHHYNISVKPLGGPSSIFMALSASGLNGQSFKFLGYPPIKEPQLIKKLKEVEATIKKNKETQIFIETPYRNDRLLGYIIKVFQSNSKLCIARDISGPHESIKQQTIGAWKKEPDYIIGRYPTIFLLG